jgi:hypothetical protein
LDASATLAAPMVRAVARAILVNIFGLSIAAFIRSSYVAHFDQPDKGSTP